MAKPQGTKIGECSKCHAPVGDQHPYSWCMECGEPLPEVLKDSIPALAQLKLTEEEREKLDSKIQKLLVTTAPFLEGYRIVETLDVITAECVFGMNVFRDIAAKLTDIFGGRSDETQKVLRDARKVCLYELRKEAHSLGANAVIAVDLNYSEFSGGGKSMLFLVASGTAVKIEQISK